MKLLCAPANHRSIRSGQYDQCVTLYDAAVPPSTASVGTDVERRVRRLGLLPSVRAWDLLSIALSITAADHIVSRDQAPDGWTRIIDLTIAVRERAFWLTQVDSIERQLRFLTTDLWSVTFVGGGRGYRPGRMRSRPDCDSVVLLSGGLDSLAGTIDLSVAGRRPFAVSQISEGDKEKQVSFASAIGGGLHHLQLNHNVAASSSLERSQRARSLLFFAYGVLAATSLKASRTASDIPLFVCENGFISLNAPLGPTRLGSLSTRTTHPVLLSWYQDMLSAAGFRVTIQNPYQFKTKGEILQGCADQALLRAHAHRSTSCGRYRRNGYMHCGRCIPCLIRRAAFRAWGVSDRTGYRYAQLSKDDRYHARYDDVRCAAMTISQAQTAGLERWAAVSLEPALVGDLASYKGILKRGLLEIQAFLDYMGVK